jgi:hypothetical protein
MTAAGLVLGLPVHRSSTTVGSEASLYAFVGDLVLIGFVTAIGLLVSAFPYLLSRSLMALLGVLLFVVATGVGAVVGSALSVAG